MEQAIIPMEEYKALNSLKDESLIVGITSWESKTWYSISNIKDEVVRLNLLIDDLRINLANSHKREKREAKELVSDIKGMSILQFIKWKRNA